MKAIKMAGWMALAVGMALPGWVHGQIAVVKSATPVVVEASDSDEDGPGQTREKRIVIRTLEPEGSREEVTWLGIATEESSEALSAQLGLKPGEGLLVTLVAEDSPAAKAGIQKHDLVVQLDGQTLVHPSQLKKLVQMRKPADTVELVYYRGGKKHETTATLGKTKQSGLLEDERIIQGGDLRELRRQFRELPLGDAIRSEMEALQKSLGRSGIDRENLSVEIKRNLEEARAALEKALRQATNVSRALGPTGKVLKDLARSGVKINEKSVVTVRSSENSVSTMVKTDESGTYVLTADPKKRLIAHDKAGKLLFEGEIETDEQRDQVPREVWEKVEPMLDQMKSQPEAE